MANVALRGLPDELHEQLRRAATRNHRSLNGEILARLESSLRPVTVRAEEVLQRVRARTGRAGTDDLDDTLLRQLKEQGRA